MNQILDDFLEKNSVRAEEWKSVLESMLNDYDAYGYAEDTLISIYEYIDEHDKISDKQIQAIENIRNKPSLYERRY